jgi:hypothetical protein
VVEGQKRKAAAPTSPWGTHSRSRRINPIRSGSGSIGFTGNGGITTGKEILFCSQEIKEKIVLLITFAHSIVLKSSTNDLLQNG